MRFVTIEEIIESVEDTVKELKQLGCFEICRIVQDMILQYKLKYHGYSSVGHHECYGKV